MVVVECDPKLLQVVHALGASGGFAGHLNGWQQQAGEDGDDRDDDEHLDEGETGGRERGCVRMGVS